MTRTLRYLLLFVFTGLYGSAIAQEIAGKIVDNKKEPLISATVQVYQGGILKGGSVTDYDGLYVVKPLDPGYYDVLVSYTSYDSIKVTRLVVTAGSRTTQNFTMSPKSSELSVVQIIAYKKPLVDIDKAGTHTMTSEEIKTVPTTELTDVAALSPSLYQSQRGKGINMGGARTSGTLYIIDGVQVQNIGEAANTGINMAQGAVEQLEVITSGIPAKYGDVSGGVVNVTSRGVSQKTTGSVRLQHSFDGYNNNLASFSMAGPIYKKKIKGDSINKKPVLGFALSGDYYDDHNRYPSYYQQYVLKPDAQKRINDNPLRIVSDNGGNRVYNYESNYVTFADLEQKKIIPNNRLREGRVNGKLDYQVTDNLRIAAGGMLDYVATDQYSRQGSLMASDGTSVKKDITSRGFFRFTQKFGKANDTSSRRAVISNAFYSVQADYQRTGTYQEDPTFKHNLFDYLYVGKFHQTRADLYSPNTVDSTSQQRVTVLTGSTSTGMTYERYNLNNTLANYTTQYYNSLDGNLPLNINQVQANNANANGDLPKLTYAYNGSGLFNSPGNRLNYYSDFKSDQYALDVNASFDLLVGKTKHAIEFGLYYQQRIIRSYAAYASRGGTNSLWALMRGLVSSVDNSNLRLDKQNPIFIVNNTRYTYVAGATPGQGTYYDPNGVAAHIIPGPGDTVVYNYKNVGTSAFDKNLRKKLFGNATDAMTRNINIDELDRSNLSLDLFSADELLNVSGNEFIDYYGYTYAGKSQGTVNFNDFWTQKDENGNYTRPIGAFSPNYIAGYIQDRFDYKDIHFNIGVRVDRYSANTKVLKDPFSLYPTYTVGTYSGATNVTNGGAHPSNMGSNYVIYVNDNTSSNPTIIGYRNGTTWYDPTGKQIEDPGVLRQYSDGRDPQPYVQKGAQKLSDTSFNPNSTFTDYSPQVTVMPRVQFSFPVSEVANFYAHYDIYAQRPYPNSIGNATAFDYYKLEASSPTDILNNANLRSQKTFDYEVGFQQKLSERSAVTITAFYKERKDMINIVPVLYAYPHNYQTYGNRDFSTTKGSTLLYDMRATNNLRMNISYTLQFAEGTGSTYNGGRGLLNNLIQEGLPNLRYVTALNYDSRHNLALNADYRYGDGEGPVVGGKNIFQNAGVNLVVKTRSGEPYTRYADALGQTVVGGVNGSRLPWHFGADMRIDKDFALKFGKRNKDVVEGVKPRRMNYIKAIATVNNLFNTREILGVSGYTGRPDDNGYLTSPFGQQYVPQQISEQSYRDLYTIYMNNPANYNYARTFSLALEFTF